MTDNEEKSSKGKGNEEGEERKKVLRQTKITGNKKVTFEDKKFQGTSKCIEIKEKEKWKRWEEEMEIMKEEIKERKREEKERQEKEKREEERIKKLEERMNKLEAEFIELKQTQEKMLERIERWESETEEGSRSTATEEKGQANRGRRGSSRSEISNDSRGNSSAKSGLSVYSLNEREVRMMKKLMQEKDRKARETNIIIKGLRVDKDRSEIEKEIGEILTDKLGVEVRLEKWRIAGRVIVVKLRSLEEKVKVMQAKAKLREMKGNIFIENDLSYEDRKVQEEIGRWARVAREKGAKVKIGRGKILVENKWFWWEDERSIRGLERQIERIDKNSLERKGEETKYRQENFL